MHALWQTVLKAVEDEGRAVLVTVMTVEGSTPREAGARMIVTCAGLRGTIGGGALEHEAWQSALRLLTQDDPQAYVSRHALGPDLGQCCGGRVGLGFEYFDRDAIVDLAQWASRAAQNQSCRTAFGNGPRAVRTWHADDGAKRPIEPSTDTQFFERFGAQRQTLHLFGAGHVGKALVMALAPLPFSVRWYDPREEMFPVHMPSNADVAGFTDPAALCFAEEDFVLIMTHSHPLDLALVVAALRSPARFVGLIGSDTKKARFQSRLRAAGFSSEVMARLICPIGVEGVSGKEPAMIAASVVAQLLIVREQSLSQAQRPERPLYKRVAMGVGA